MREELEKALVRDFPNLYREHGGDPKSTCMAWGIAVGDGWEPLIRELSEKITKLDPECVAAQVKEKFGGLRFYVNGATREAYDAISEAEGKSYEICERCGEPGTQRGGGWIVTLCEKCYKQSKCKHENTYIENSPDPMLSIPRELEICKDCGKIVKDYLENEDD